MWSGKLVIAGEARRSLDVGSQKAKKTKQNLFCFVFFYGAPGMGNNLVVKVHYRLGSRNC
ncbi:hypothetical protein B5F98_09275 [Pseudoflavonifractor sp. An44]|nr:hypothetical protein B5F98_09275 [Pseudoflavonifractor sp. An44]